MGLVLSVAKTRRANWRNFVASVYQTGGNQYCSKNCGSVMGTITTHIRKDPSSTQLQLYRKDTKGDEVTHILVSSEKKLFLFHSDKKSITTDHRHKKYSIREITRTSYAYNKDHSVMWNYLFGRDPNSIDHISSRHLIGAVVETNQMESHSMWVNEKTSNEVTAVPQGWRFSKSWHPGWQSLT